MTDRRSEADPRRQDTVTATRLDSIHDNYVRWGNRTVEILLAITLIVFLIGCGSIYLYTRIDTNSRRFEAEAEARSVNIQMSRADAELLRCEEQNTANKATKAAVQRDIDSGTASLEQGQAVLGLVDALAPFTPNCRARVFQLTGVRIP